ncbi:ATP-dependent (S)-NAD(P)H-hydrate dehydratase [Diplonema papillatum]|nr:ATP-dependent (S)-NAD(P)H-hydrate dehydratase [Diplonema papillatum]|eukprot:gene2260-3491_t
MKQQLRTCLCGKTGFELLKPPPAAPVRNELEVSRDAVRLNGEEHVKKWNDRLFCGLCGAGVGSERGDRTLVVPCAAGFLAPDEAAAAECLRALAPPLEYTRHKGQGGRVGVLGGSDVFTGAPYFASVASLRAGGELVYVMTAREAADSIKSYSPELMVTPVYRTERMETDADAEQARMVAKVRELQTRFHAFVLGPGLGTNDRLVPPLREILGDLPPSLPVVIDADGLRLLAQHPDMISRLETCVLTPNAREVLLFLDGEDTKGAAPESLAKRVAAKLGAVVVLKGKDDIVTDGEVVLKCSVEGCPRRVGGLGDFLSGTLGLVLGWRGIAIEAGDSPPSVLETCRSACVLVRRAARLAYADKHRAMSTLDVLDQIGPAFDHLCPPSTSSSHL